MRPDLDGIVGRVPSGHRGSRPARPSGFPAGSPPGVVHRRRRHDAADGHPAICRIDVQLVADPRRGMALGVALGTDIAAVGRSAASAGGSSSVAVPDGSAPSPAPLPCAAVPACAALRFSAFGLRLLPRPRSPSRPARCAPPDGRPSSRNHRLVQTARKTALGELGKGPRKRRLARKPAAAAPAAKPGSCPPNLKTLDQRPRRRNVEHRLGDEGARQRSTVLLRPPYLAAETGEQCLRPEPAQDCDEKLVALAQRAQIALEPRESSC